MFVRSAVVLIVSVGLMGCHPHGVKPGMKNCVEPTRPSIPFQVRLQVHEDPLGGSHLLVIEPAQCGGGSTEKGCIRVPSGHKSKITFLLIGGKDENCTGGNPNNPWRLEGVRMSMAAKTPGTVTAQVQCDFYTDVNGEVQNPDTSGGGPRMTIRDWNQDEYKVWYTVRAVNCNNGEVISTDPWVENKG